MIYKLDDNILDQFINDFAEGQLTKAELQAFSELQDSKPSVKRSARAGMEARKNLRKLPFVGCRPGFNQRLAAKFSRELQMEKHDLKKNSSSTVVEL